MPIVTEWTESLAHCDQTGRVLLFKSIRITTRAPKESRVRGVFSLSPKQMLTEGTLFFQKVRLSSGAKL